ncbi:MAG: M67 family metallopeptidase [Kiritimatiellia bacterium]
MSAPFMRLIEPGLEARIRRHLEAQYPAEGCGVLIGGGDGTAVPWEIADIVPAPNHHGGDRARRYLIPPELQLQAERAASARGLDVVGFYHSHPDHPARPSEHDRELAWPGYVYAICAVAKGVSAEMESFTLNEAGEFVEVAAPDHSAQ